VQLRWRIVDRNGVMAMVTIAGTQRVRQCWRRLAKWQRRLLIVVAVLVCSAWIGIGSIGGLVRFSPGLPSNYGLR
jgi:hypothetical protein